MWNPTTLTSCTGGSVTALGKLHKWDLKTVANGISRQFPPRHEGSHPGKLRDCGNSEVGLSLSRMNFRRRNMQKSRLGIKWCLRIHEGILPVCALWFGMHHWHCNFQLFGVWIWIQNSNFSACAQTTKKRFSNFSKHLQKQRRGQGFTENHQQVGSIPGNWGEVVGTEPLSS